MDCDNQMAFGTKHPYPKNRRVLQVQPLYQQVGGLKPAGIYRFFQGLAVLLQSTADNDLHLPERLKKKQEKYNARNRQV
jgi:hypothetical protein